jgi:hypothetical protein
MDHARRRQPGDVDFCEDDCPRCGSCRVRVRTDAAGEHHVCETCGALVWQWLYEWEGES